MPEELDLQKHSKYFFTACFIIIILASLYMVRHYLIAVISAMLLTYIFYPLYKGIKKIIINENISSLLTSLMILIIILIPTIFAGNALVNESIQVFNKVKNIDFSNFEEKLSRYFDERIELDEYLKDFLNKFSLLIARETSDFLITLPRRALSFFIMLFIMFYLFKQGKDLIYKIESHLPLKESHRNHLSTRFNNVVYASLYGLVVTAVVQGAVGTLGLWVFGVSSPILWGVVMTILAMLPFVGAFLVWFPASISKIFSGDLFNGFGLLIYGLLIISTIDNIIRPKIIGSKGKIHPVLVLLGVVGGLKVFGVLGFIIGPLILAILTVFLDLYLLERSQSKT